MENIKLLESEIKVEFLDKLDSYRSEYDGYVDDIASIIDDIISEPEIKKKKKSISGLARLITEDYLFMMSPAGKKIASLISRLSEL